MGSKSMRPWNIEPFEKYALEYDKWYSRNPGIAESEAKAVSILPLRGLGVEVGVGSGFFAQRAGTIIGLEPAVAMARLAKERGIWVIGGVGELMPLRDGSMDYVLVVVTICFLQDPSMAIAEAHRVLRDGGKLVVCIVPRDSEWGKLYVRLGALGHRFYSRARFFSVKEVVDMLGAVGLKVSEEAVATLSRGVGNYYEEPSLVKLAEAERYGFVCIVSTKAPGLSQPPAHQPSGARMNHQR